MAEPICRFPLSVVEAHRAEVAALKARIVEFENAAHPMAALVSIDDLREILLDEANEDSGVVRSCIEWSDEDEQGHVEVVDTIRELCARVRQQAEQLASAQVADALDEPKPCGCGCAEDGVHWSVSAGIGDSKGGSYSGFSTVERALVWLAQENAGQRVGSGREPWNQKTFHAKVNDVVIKRDAEGFLFVPQAKEKATKTPAAPAPAVDDPRQFVASRRDAHGLRFWWGNSTKWQPSHVGAVVFAGPDREKNKPARSKLIAVDDVPAILEAEAAKPKKEPAPQVVTVPTAVVPVRVVVSPLAQGVVGTFVVRRLQRNGPDLWLGQDDVGVVWSPDVTFAHRFNGTEAAARAAAEAGIGLDGNDNELTVDRIVDTPKPAPVVDADGALVGDGMPDLMGAP